MSKYFNPKSMTWWGGILTVGLGVTTLAQGQWPAGLALVGKGLAVIGVRTAIEPLIQKALESKAQGGN